MASGSGSGRDRGIPRSLEGLLKFSVENRDGTEEAQNAFQEMSEERKKWLQEAMSSFIENDDVNKMKACIEVLQKPDDDAENDEKLTEKEQAFEVLAMLTEGIDNAKDLHKIGGFQVVVRFLNSSQSSLRWRAADLLAVCVQNNPYCQKAVVDLDIIPLLLTLVDSDPSEQVRVKALYAVSCLCRDCPEAENIFVDKDGFSVLMRAMESDTAKLKIKAIFLLNHLIITSPAHKDVLLNMGIVEQLALFLQQTNELFHEHVLHVLICLAEGSPRAVEEYFRPELKLEDLLRDKVEQYKNENPEMYMDAISRCIELLKVLKKQSNTDSNFAATR